MRFRLHGARLVDASLDLSGGDIVVEDELIKAVGYQQGAVDGELVIDAADAVIVPGFIEVHTHGGGGYRLHTTSVAEIQSYARWATTTGVTAFLAAVVGVPAALPEPQVRTVVAAVRAFAEKSHAPGAEPLGIHLEGPYISSKRRGAHPPAWLRTPDEAETARLLEVSEGYLRLITLAPELPGAREMIRRMIEAGVTVSMGHTDSNYEQSVEAIRLGITHMTHCFNAMRPLLHREPGPLAAVVQEQRVFGEIIADGVHVHPAVVNALIRMLGPERTIVVTDAQAGAGLPLDAVFEFAGQKLHIAQGAARLENGALAGSVLTMDSALRNIIQMTGVSLQEAVGMLTLNPAKAARVDNRKARLRCGYEADLLILDNSLKLQATLCRGTPAFATAAWRERLQSLMRPL
ncbi:MAG: N-acetylglucosamine-6-phosphate deacetylase [Ktedonobacteraceae bacterium]|nr:N-acetylglucosamine-6-phosphate deacetylase [Ktedonobacteraceae bacterium]